MRTAVAVMRERLAEPVTLADLAAEVHLSVYHLVRVFKDATGETPHRFLTRLRITAARCGFTGAGPLSAAFLRHTGTRPSAYRNS